MTNYTQSKEYFTTIFSHEIEGVPYNQIRDIPKFLVAGSDLELFSDIGTSVGNFKPDHGNVYKITVHVEHIGKTNRPERPSSEYIPNP